MKITIATFLAAGLLVACGDTSDDEVTDIDTPEDNEEELQDEDNDTDGVEEEDDAEEEATGSNESDAVGSGSFEDQEDLRIRDTGQVSSNIGEYSLTVNEVAIEEEIDGQSPQLEKFFLVDVTLENIGDSSLDVEEIIGNFEISSNLDGSGATNVSNHFDNFALQGDQLEPGESISNELVFDWRGTEEYYIRIIEGLISSGGVHNQVIWTFDESEAE